MNPATPVITHTRGLDRSSSRSCRYAVEITVSQWREYPQGRLRASVRGSTPARSNAPLPRLPRNRDEASSIPRMPAPQTSLSAVKTDF